MTSARLLRVNGPQPQGNPWLLDAGQDKAGRVYAIIRSASMGVVALR